MSFKSKEEYFAELTAVPKDGQKAFLDKMSKIGLPRAWIVDFATRLDAPAPEPPLPSKPRMARNLAVAMVKIAKEAASGAAVTRTDDEIERVHDICLHCPSALYRASDDRCAHHDCGCHLKRKIWFHAQHCPSGHW